MAIPQSHATPRAAAADLAALMHSVDPAETASAPQLALAPNHKFFLRHHPAQWDADGVGLDKVTWLPDIAPLVMVPGAHLIRTRKAGEAPNKTYENAMNVDGNKGWVHLDPNEVIPADCLPTGVPAGGYLRSLPCKDPRSSTEGHRYVETWNVPRAPLPGRKQEFRFDRASYNRWRLWLVTSGKIAPPTPDVIAEMQAAKAGRPARIASLPIPDDLRKVRVEAIEAELSAMEKAAVPKATRPVRDEAAASHIADERARLEEERADIEAARADLAAERKRLETERKKAEKAAKATDPAPPPAAPGGDS